MNSWPERNPRYANAEWLALSRRSFIDSYGATSATNCAPTRSQAGRPATKRSSIAHCLNGSCTTGAASCKPSAASLSAMSRPVVAGTMRSTIVDGKRSFATDPARQRRVAQFGEGENESRDQRAVVRQVVAAQDGERRAVREPARIQRAGDQSDDAAGWSGCARSCTISGMRGIERPVAGSWQ